MGLNRNKTYLLLNLEAYVELFIERGQRKLALLMFICIVFVVLICVYFSRTPIYTWEAVASVCAIFMSAWLIISSVFDYRDTVSWLKNIELGSFLDALEKYGDKETVISEIESEIISPLYVNHTSRSILSFCLTEHWIINFAMLPEPFIFQYSDILFITGNYDSTKRGTPYRFYFKAHFRSFEMRIPIYVVSDQVRFIRHLRSIRPNIPIEFPIIYEQYFTKILTEADMEKDS